MHPNIYNDKKFTEISFSKKELELMVKAILFSSVEMMSVEFNEHEKDLLKDIAVEMKKYVSGNNMKNVEFHYMNGGDMTEDEMFVDEHFSEIQKQKMTWYPTHENEICPIIPTVPSTQTVSYHANSSHSHRF